MLVEPRGARWVQRFITGAPGEERAALLGASAAPSLTAFLTSRFLLVRGVAVAATICRRRAG
jgi:hypothetical protein